MVYHSESSDVHPLQPVLGQDGLGSGQSHKQQQQEPPADKFHLTYISFFILGVGILFPWNSIITAADYFKLSFGENVEFLFTCAYMLPMQIIVVVMLFWGSQISFRVRIVGSYALFLAGLAALPFMGNLYVACGIICIIGGIEALMQSSIFAMVSQFHPKYVSATMSGEGIAGLFVALLRISTKASMPNNDDGTRDSAYIYFGISYFFIGLCIFVYEFVIHRSPVTKFYLARAHEQKQERQRVFDEQGVKRRRSGSYSRLEDEGDADAISRMERGESSLSATLASTWFFFKQIWKPFVSVFNCFFVTLAFFPAITSEMQSTNPDLNRTGWFGILLMGTFMVGDLIGRTAPNVKQLIWLSSRTILLASLLRYVFWVLFVLCVSKVLDADWYYYLFMFLFSLTNGYVGTLAIMFASDDCHNDDKERAGTWMVFGLTLGLTAGVFLAFPIKVIVDAAFV